MPTETKSTMKDRVVAAERRLFESLVDTRIPVYMHSGIVRYIVEGAPPGDFLHAVFSDKLVHSFSKADENNQKVMRDYAGFLYNHAPIPCWGSGKAVQEWIKHGGLLGLGAI